MTAFTNIAAVARRTGVPPDTLRKWEQRYGVLQPTRSAGGHRRYTDVDVRRVEWLKARLDEGYRIGEAAAMLGGDLSDVADSPRELRDSIYAALVGADVTRVRSLLDQTFGMHGMSAALNEVIAPLLVRTGDGWESGDLTVAHEHLLSAEVRARLSPLAISTAVGVRGSAVLACAPGERHELGLLMLTALLRADGWRVAYLGSDTPVDAALAMVRYVEADILCLSASIDERLPRLERELRGAKAVEGMTVFVGGRVVDAEAAEKLGAQWAGADLATATRAIAKVAR
jgi:MerR family transcriptional regulator, light-induced transcriptional regulator